MSATTPPPIVPTSPRPLVKSKPLAYAIAIGFVTVLIGVIVLAIQADHYVLGASFGESCRADKECASAKFFSTPICLQDEDRAYCTKDCATDSDCPSEYACGELSGYSIARPSGSKACVLK